MFARLRSEPPRARRATGRGLVSSTPPSRGRDHLLARIEAAITTAPPGPSDRPVSALTVVTGPAAGTVVALGPGRHLIGRSDDADLCLTHASVSRIHASIDVGVDGHLAVTDRGSTNGTRIDGRYAESPAVLSPTAIVRLGAVAVAFAPPPPPPIDRPAEPVAPRPFNRSPRPASPPPLPPLRPPDGPPAGTSRPPFAWAVFAAPIVLGVGMAAFFGPMLALFTLLGPLLFLASWIEQRHRGVRGTRRQAIDHRAQVDRFAHALRSRHALDLARRRGDEPDLAALAARARALDPRLWERRPEHPDHLRLAVGLGDLAWSAPLTPTDASHTLDVAELVHACGPLWDVPVTVELGHGGVVAIVGDAPSRLALARQLVVRAAVLHGPADLSIAALTEDGKPAHDLPAGDRPDDDRPDDDSADGDRTDDAWAWLDVLPHRSDATHLVGPLAVPTPTPRADDRSGRATWLLVAEADVLRGRTPARRLVTDHPGVATIVLADHADDVPANAVAVIELTDGTTGTLVDPATGQVIHDISFTGCTSDLAHEVARSLQHLDDLEATETARDEPVELIQLLDLPDGRGAHDDGDLRTQIVRQWSEPPSHPLRAVLGCSGPGRSGLGRPGGTPLEVDLATDGPHALIGGTTGSGKSELLRTWVLSLALRTSPDHLTFLLVDYKGGSAFDACARLPHTVGVVTDLDAELGTRALISLEAELRRRETVLRAAGAVDLAAHRADPASKVSPLPAFVVVIDEFAALSAELPGFVDRLVGVAQRGRSLGVHLVLATQRPAGVVSDAIRANTNLRVALRVADAHDSVDVIGTPDAVTIPRDRPGSAFVRFGPADLVPTRFAHADPDSLGRLVTLAGEAAAEAGIRPPRRVWLPPLPTSLTIEELDSQLSDGVDGPPDDPREGPAGATRRHLSLPLARADAPHLQEQHPWSWTPRRGNLVTIGMPGSGTSTVLATTALTFARHRPDGHVYVIDHDGSLTALDRLPHTGAVLGADELARHRRLVRHLTATLASRRTSSHGDQPDVLVVIDDLPGLLGRHDDLEGLRFVDHLQRLYADGPAHGIHIAASSPRVGGLPSALLALTEQRLVLRLPDRYDHATVGLGPTAHATTAGPTPPGRGWVPGDLEVQVARADPSLDQAVARACLTAPTGPPRPAIGELPETVSCAELAGIGQTASHPWFLPLAIGDDHLAACGLVLHPGEHALIVGPPRSGRTTALDALDAVATASGAVVIRIAGPDLDGPGLLSRLTRHLDTAVLVLIDDADRVTDTDDVLATLVSATRPGVHVIAAGRADRLRSRYGDWTTHLRESGTGLVLRPDPDLDGDLWSIRLPRRREALAGRGRGYLVTAGEVELVQVATP